MSTFNSQAALSNAINNTINLMDGMATTVSANNARTTFNRLLTAQIRQALTNAGCLGPNINTNFGVHTGTDGQFTDAFVNSGCPLPTNIRSYSSMLNNCP